jgi:hypothetical protein
MESLDYSLRDAQGLCTPGDYVGERRRELRVLSQGETL